MAKLDIGQLLIVMGNEMQRQGVMTLTLQDLDALTLALRDASMIAQTPQETVSTVKNSTRMVEVRFLANKDTWRFEVYRLFAGTRQHMATFPQGEDALIQTRDFNVQTYRKLHQLLQGADADDLSDDLFRLIDTMSEA